MALLPSRTRRRLALSAVLGTLLPAAGCSPVVPLNALARTDTYRTSPDVAYGALPRQRLDVFTPRSTAPAHGWPLVVFFYGGSWTSGGRAGYRFVGEALASRGILTLVADYRLYPQVRYPEFLVDSATALAWGLEHAAALGADPRRVFVMGHSAGGYNAAMLALDPRWLAATGHRPEELAGWVGLAGPYEFFPLGADSPARPVFFHPDYPPRSQPIEHAGASRTKAYLAASMRDRVVNPQRSTLALAAKLRAAGGSVELKMYEGLGHSLLIGAFARPLRGLAPVLDDVSAWIVGG